MKLQIFALLFICVICVASGVQQLGRPEGKVITIGNITNKTNMTNLTNNTGNFSNQTNLNMSGLNASRPQANGNESVMETPSKAGSQPDLSRYDFSSLGKGSNVSGLNPSLFPDDANESVMETPSQAGSQSDVSRYDLSSLGEESGGHDEN